MENISWTDHVRKEEVLQIVKEERKNPTNNKKTEGWLEWSHLAYELPPKTHYWRTDSGKDRGDGKMKKKAEAAAGQP